LFGVAVSGQPNGLTVATAGPSTFTLNSGQIRTDIDLGFRGTASLGDVVFLDSNGNGRQDGGTEAGIAGISVQLFYDRDNDGAFTSAGENLPLLSTTTAAGGAYSFANLAAGNYQVVFGNSGGATTYARTVKNSAVATAATDSDGDPTTGRTATFTLTNGQTNTTADQGLYVPVTLGDRVYFDYNGDGIQQAGEPGISGATVTVVWLGPDGTFGTADDQTFSTTTGASGIWSIGSLPPGSYRVSVATPAGYSALSDSIDDGTLSAVNPVTISVTSGATRSDVDFGYRGTASIGDRVYLDTNGDGVQQAGE
jgi:hypothetical protein